MSLPSETQIRAAKPGPKEYLLNDGDNLYLRVRVSGKAWAYRYTKGGKAVKPGMGPYSEVTLAQHAPRPTKPTANVPMVLIPKKYATGRRNRRTSRACKPSSCWRGPGTPAPRRTRSGRKTTPRKSSGTWKFTSFPG
ncbi:Arm DNA-binding domain-containing protein [Castellaniella sp.]|uniref:Arm DNA-binding domain-containing protein n=1 Tax=Castellaniella sp. TaxID=1955812 RepID=UPI003C788681